MNHLRLFLTCTGLVAAMGAGTPILAADPPAGKSGSASALPADTRAKPVRFALQLIRTDVVVPPAVTLTTPPTVPVTVPAAPAPAGTTPPVAPVPILLPSGPITSTLATPTLLTLDGSTASIAVSGGDFGYTFSLSPTIAADGKLLVLWNLRLSGKSLPGATGVSATGAVRIDIGKPVGIAEVSLTDPATGRMATFRLQGIATTGADASAPVPVGAVAPAPPAPAAP